jgi:addiction module HigA family antidote
MPGEILQEALDERHMTQAELAERMGRPKKTINEIIKGKAAITPETALQLEAVLGIETIFWTNLEGAYRESLARAEERQRLEGEIEWLKEIPLKHMLSEGWIRKFDDKVDQLREALAFFRIASTSQWQKVITAPQAAFRQSSAYEKDVAATAAWLQQGVIEASRVPCARFDPDTFRASLLEVRGLTREANPSVFLPKLHELCTKSGVAFILLKEVKGSRVSGVARWVSKDKGLIQLSGRFRVDDQLWFSFFHEAAHLLLHGRNEVFLEGQKVADGRMEDEANEFAADFLIPKQFMTKVRAAIPTPATVIALSNELGIAPGIVVGRLQKEGIVTYSDPMNHLKHRYAWRG